LPVAGKVDELVESWSMSLSNRGVEERAQSSSLHALLLFCRILFVTKGKGEERKAKGDWRAHHLHLSVSANLVFCKPDFA
jgi:hypothetical protein